MRQKLEGYPFRFGLETIRVHLLGNLLFVRFISSLMIAPFIVLNQSLVRQYSPLLCLRASFASISDPLYFSRRAVSIDGATTLQIQNQRMALQQQTEAVYYRSFEFIYVTDCHHLLSRLIVLPNARFTFYFYQYPRVSILKFFDTFIRPHIECLRTKAPDILSVLTKGMYQLLWTIQ